MVKRERMGSGGPRGLQILRSGACVRGGFDSHAFPPLLLRALGVALLAMAAGLTGASAAGAQSAPPDSLGDRAPAAIAPGDSVTIGGSGMTALPVAVTGDSIVRGKPAGPTPWPDQPRFVMLRSLLIPGWGQAYNRAWIKAVGVAGGEIWLGSLIIDDKNALELLLDVVNATDTDSTGFEHNEAVNRYNTRLETYVRHQWFFGALLAYALIDAYVDAHFRDFDIEFKHDPALPDDEPVNPAAPNQEGSVRRGGTSLALRWHF